MLNLLIAGEFGPPYRPTDSFPIAAPNDPEWPFESYDDYYGWLEGIEVRLLLHDPLRNQRQVKRLAAMDWLGTQERNLYGGEVQAVLPGGVLTCWAAWAHYRPFATGEAIPPGVWLQLEESPDNSSRLSEIVVREGAAYVARFNPWNGIRLWRIEPASESVSYVDWPLVERPASPDFDVYEYLSVSGSTVKLVSAVAVEREGDTFNTEVYALQGTPAVGGIALPDTDYFTRVDASEGLPLGPTFSENEKYEYAALYVLAWRLQAAGFLPGYAVQNGSEYAAIDNAENDNQHNLLRGTAGGPIARTPIDLNGIASQALPDLDGANWLYPTTQIIDWELDGGSIAAPPAFWISLINATQTG